MENLGLVKKQVHISVAVLLVLFHHAKVPPFQAGHLGVDIFRHIQISDHESGGSRGSERDI